MAASLKKHDPITIDPATLVPIEIDKRITQLTNEAGAVAIANPLEADAASEILRRIKLAEADVTEERMKSTRPLDTAKANIMGIYKPRLERLAQAKSYVEAMLRGWISTQRRIEDEKRQRAEDERRKEAERLDKLAMKNAVKNPERAQAQADTAMALRAAPVFVEEAPPIAGLGTAKRWKGEVTDVFELCMYIAGVERRITNGKSELVRLPQQHPELAHLLVADQPVVNNYARVSKGATQIPGVRTYEAESLASR